MKCEKCKEREANFFYTATINGETTQRRLCTECAREEGLDRAFDWRGDSIFDGLFAEPFGMLEEFFGHGSLLGAMMPTMTLPRLRLSRPETREQPAEESAGDKIPEDAGAEIRAKRELAALRSQMQEAVKAENFEKAIELRDKIREMEK